MYTSITLSLGRGLQPHLITYKLAIQIQKLLISLTFSKYLTHSHILTTQVMFHLTYQIKRLPMCFPFT